MGEKIERVSLVNQVHTSIISRIQNGVIAPGERLNIEDLAVDFGVSRTPVREAISKLTQEGFVEQVYNSGPRVVRLNGKQMRDVIRTNATLFSGVIESYASMHPKTHEALIRKLTRSVDAQRFALEDGDIDSFYQHSVRFHIDMIEACQNEMMKKFALQTQYQINMCALYYQKDEAIRSRGLEEHEQILACLQKKDFGGAIALMCAHNREGEEHISLEALEA